MVDYQKWADVFIKSKYGHHVLEFCEVIEINKLLVLIEMREHLSDIKEQIHWLRLELAEKADPYIADRIEADKVLVSLLKDIARPLEEQEKESIEKDTD